MAKETMASQMEVGRIDALSLSRAILFAHQAPILEHWDACASTLWECFEIGAHGKPTTRPHLCVSSNHQ